MKKQQQQQQHCVGRAAVPWLAPPSPSRWRDSGRAFHLSPGTQVCCTWQDPGLRCPFNEMQMRSASALLGVSRSCANTATTTHIKAFSSAFSLTGVVFTASNIARLFFIARLFHGARVAREESQPGLFRRVMGRAHFHLERKRVRFATRERRVKSIVKKRNGGTGRALRIIQTAPCGVSLGVALHASEGDELNKASRRNIEKRHGRRVKGSLRDCCLGASSRHAGRDQFHAEHNGGAPPLRARIRCAPSALLAARS